MDEKDFKRLMIPAVVIVLAILAFFVLKPIVVPVLLGLLLAYIFYPLYRRIYTKIKSKNISGVISVLIMLLIIVIPLATLLPSFIKQLFSFYLSMKSADFSGIITNTFPSLLESSGISTEIIAAISHVTSSISAWVFSVFQSTLMSIPALAVGMVILLFVMFFGLVDGENFKDYFSTIFPFPKEHKESFYKRFDQVTSSILYGHLIVGLAQGVIAGIGYFMFGVPNALLLTVLTAVVGVLPIVGPWLVWIPVDIFLFLKGDNVAGMQLLIFGLFVINWVDILLRPQIIARKAEMNKAIALIGAIGGIYAFGLIGFILGPLILAYLILLIEIYKGEKGESIIIKNPEADKNLN